MRQKNLRFTGLGALCMLTLTMCRQPAIPHEKIEPAHVEHIAGSEISRVTLLPKAMERLDIQTVPVRKQKSASASIAQKIVPYSALLYDPTGNTWVYTAPELRTFVRYAVNVSRIEGDLVFLTDGPAIGMAVVSVGAAELYGAEFEIGH